MAQGGAFLEVYPFTPVPTLAKGDFDAAKATYYGGIDLLNRIPETGIAYRMPCCDSINSPSPRFYQKFFPVTPHQGRAW